MKKQKQYNHLKIEKKWQKTWEAKDIYKTSNNSKKKPYYVLDMFPYPSGQGLHVGHPRGYIGSDVFARMKRMQGFNVLHPMGFDAFGLPAEQYAIQTGKHPSIITKAAIARYKKQLEIIGFSYDWSREVQTIDPEYYKWTQWIFLQIYDSWYDKKKNKARSVAELVTIFEKSGNSDVDAFCDADVKVFSAKEWKAFSEKQKQDMLMKYRLAYEGYAEVNWCAELGTVLANDEVLEKDGKLVSERGDYPVERKSMRQWFMRITAYADRLISGLDLVDFADSTKETQKNWIGKSEGSEINFKIKDNEKQITVFTTRADTLFGVTYVVLAPEHNFVQELLPHCENKKEVEKYIEIVKNKTQEERTESKEKTGVELKGVYAINPANGEHVPVWTADYVLASYGTGAVMAVPAHDERDFEFAKKYNLPIKQVIVPDFGTPKENETYVNGSCAVVYSPEKNKFAILKWNYGLFGLIAGGQKDNEVLEEVIRRELIEEGGFSNIQKLERLWQASAHYYNEAKNTYRHADTVAFLAIVSESTQPQELEEHEKFELIWVTPEEIMQNWNQLNESIGLNHWITFLDKALHRLKEAGYEVSPITPTDKAFTGNGLITNSGLFNAIHSEEVKKKITEFVGGKFVTKYKMRDAIFARQRYWGEPIPLIQKPIEPKLEVEFSGDFIYKLLKEGKKTIEVRALDKKGRKDVRVGDTLKFIHLEKKDSFLVVVKDVHIFKNISELYKKGSHLFTQIFPGENINSLEALYERFRKVAPEYDKRIDKHGCVAWQIEKINEGDLTSTFSEKQLPLKLPNVKSYKPTGTGESPLAGVKSWVTAGYETNTMPGWAGSSWYFLRYMDPKNKKALVGEKEIKYWKNVDMYVGGTEHNTGHLLYARFWHKFLYDIGVAKTEEPFKALRHQGMIGGADGRKMSKRWGNVVNPDDVVKTYGADTLRVFEMFLGPFEGSLPWSTEGIIGSRRFVERVWRLGERVLSENHKKTNDALTTVLHKTIKKVTEDIESFNFNTAVSSMMIFVNEAEKEKELSIKDFKLFLAILAPFASHMADELWQQTGEKTSIHLAPWPKYNQKFLVESSVTIAVQINGKVRGSVLVPADSAQEVVEKIVFSTNSFDQYLKDVKIKKTIYVTGKLISFVV